MQTTNFFQSLEFGEFQEKIPYRGKTWVLRDKNLGDICLVIKQKLRFGKSMLWIPYLRNIEIWEMILDELGRIAQEENAIFARIELPSLENLSKFIAGGDGEHKLDSSQVLHWLKCQCAAKQWLIKKSFERFTPEQTLALDLTLSEEDLLKQMKPKGRYNINVAKRHGVLIKKYSSLDTKEIKSCFDKFYEIFLKTGSRDKFRVHPKYFYQTFIDFFGSKNMSLFFAAEYKNEVIGGIIVVFYGDTAIYYYGASDYKKRNLMAPYLLQWEAIREAKNRELKYYDFLGISQNPSHEWYGVTEFKKKFGGTIIKYGPAFDIVYQPFFYFLLKFKRQIMM